MYFLFLRYDWSTILIEIKLFQPPRNYKHAICGYVNKHIGYFNQIFRMNHYLHIRPHCRICRIALQWHHNERDDVSNHRPLGCLFNRMFRRRSKKTSKLRVTGLCEGNLLATGGLPSQMASNAGNVSIDDAIMGLIVISFCRWRTATYDTREICLSSAKFSLYHKCVFFDMHRALIIIIQELYGNANQNPNKSYTIESSRAHSAHYNFSYFYGDKFMCGIQFLSYKVSKVYFCICELAALIYMLQEITMGDWTGLHSWKLPGSSKDNNCMMLLLAKVLQRYSDKKHWSTSIIIHWKL